jgi:hypothetical protein
MKKPSFSTLLLSGFLALAFLGGLVTPVSATAQPGSQQMSRYPSFAYHRRHLVPQKIATYIALQEPATISLGKPFTLSGTIKDQSGKPVANKSILFTIDGEYLGQARSNEDGIFERKFTKDLNAGTYTIKATSNATHTLETAVTDSILKILPAKVRVQTVPAISGIPFRMNGIRFVSGKDGYATVEIDKSGQYRLEVLVDQYQSPTKRIEFARWLEESYKPYQDIEVPTDKIIQVGFNVYHLVGQSFFDLDGLAVSPQRVAEFSIRSAQGDMFVLHDGQPRWIPASRVARRALGLEETQLLYSVLSVTVDGSNVVNQSQQRFYTYPIENWPISLLLYSMNISAKDGLFGSPVGKSVNVEFPDGHVENYPLDENGKVEIRSLARGNYYTELVGTYGLSNRTPVALSRNQDVTTKVVTYLDMATVGLLGIVLALGLLFYGRPSILNIGRKRNRQAARNLEQSLLPQAYTGSAVELYDYRQMRYETVKMLDDRAFHVATGVEREIFEKMLAFYQKQFRTSGKQPKLSGADQILLTLLFLREHRSDFEIGHIYGVSERTVRRTVKKVKNILMNSIEFELSGKTLIEADMVEVVEQQGVESVK